MKVLFLGFQEGKGDKIILKLSGKISLKEFKQISELVGTPVEIKITPREWRVIVGR